MALSELLQKNGEEILRGAVAALLPPLEQLERELAGEDEPDQKE